LYFRPEPQWHGSLRPGRAVALAVMPTTVHPLAGALRALLIRRDRGRVVRPRVQAPAVHVPDLNRSAVPARTRTRPRFDMDVVLPLGRGRGHDNADRAPAVQ
jgi:hypothetical protein